MNKLNFKNESYKKIALSLQSQENDTHSPGEAFFLLINGISKEDLINLCEIIQQQYNLSIDECYNITQNLNANIETKNMILELAYHCIKSGKHLGNNFINNGMINTSSWISHSLYTSEVCSTIANSLNLNTDRAKTLGLMHDYGRKFDHTFQHTMDGFEKLLEMGWINEAIGCLTHSFVNGGRCSNNEQAINGFFIDKQGNPQWKDKSYKDDITLFLESYNYTPYDIILNIADLMATDKGIFAPHERIADISIRRIIDPINRRYFLSEVTNMLINYLKNINYCNQELPYIKATKDKSLEEIENYFNLVSEHFFYAYNELTKSTKKHL